MATLYYTPTSCGAASFIAQSVAGLNLKTEVVDIGTHKILSNDSDFYAVNPKGNVPALVLPGGVLLNEGAAVLQWIADQAPKSQLAPAAGTVERYSLINELNFVATDLHSSGFGPLFNPNLKGDARDSQLKKLAGRLEYLDSKILAGGKKFVVGNNFTIVDSYLSVVLSWAPYVGADLSAFANINNYTAAIAALPQVQEAKAKLASK